MASKYRIERGRGIKEFPQQLAVLRKRWPLAFPVKHQDVRPLAIGAARGIAAEMGWPLPYTLGVLGNWKMAPVYCQAVLGYDQRIALDGAPAEAVGAEAKDLAAKRLAELAARKAPERAGMTAAPDEADACLGGTRRDAGTIARPRACCAPAPDRVAAFVAAR